jgi:hypothetical protein
MVVKTEGVSTDGKPMVRENRFKTDGNEYPYDGPWGKGTVVVTVTDPYHWTQVVKQDGGNTITTQGVLSKDGKTRTQTTTGTTAKGDKVNTITVYERQ